MGAVASRNLDSGVEWATPQAFFDGISGSCGPFDLDAAASPSNAKVARFYTRAEDGLQQPWTGHVWCNPPYGRMSGRSLHEAWVRRGFEAAQAREAGSVTMLLPAATDTAWWHDYAMEACQIALVRGRLRFNDGKGGGTFPSVVVRWVAGYEGGPQFHAVDRNGRALPSRKQAESKRGA